MSSKTLEPVPDRRPEVGPERQHRAEKWLDTEIEECPDMNIYSQYWLQVVGYSHLWPVSTLRWTNHNRLPMLDAHTLLIH